MGGNYYVYILTNKNNDVLYVGVTNNLIKRTEEHREKIHQGFTNKYNLNKLVYYEWFTSIEYAIAYEKQLKNWHRQWKINLINKENSSWKDLYNDLIGI